MNPSENEASVLSKKPYWYHTTTVSCVLCMREKIYRERRYTPKPQDAFDRWAFEQDDCGYHFV